MPATIGVLDGRLRVGLTADELQRLADTPGVPKLNLLDRLRELTEGASVFSNRALLRANGAAAVALAVALVRGRRRARR